MAISAGDSRDVRAYLFGCVRTLIDRQFPKDVPLVAQYIGELFERVLSSQRSNKIPEKNAVFPLLLNALTTSMAALELWRRGFLLQVGVLLRAAFEIVATAAVITSDQAARRRYLVGSYRSSAAPGDLKKVLPMIGGEVARATGFLSNNFVHVGESHQVWLGVSSRLSDHELQNLKSMLLPIKVAVHVIDMSSEMVCWEVVGTPRYWQRMQSKAYAFQISAEGDEWMRTLFKEDLEIVVKDDFPKATQPC